MAADGSAQGTPLSRSEASDGADAGPETFWAINVELVPAH
jgi:hypothetical protein